MQLEGAGLIAQHLLVLYLDNDALVGTDIGHGRSEHVGTLGFDQVGLATLLAGFFVEAAGLLALVNAALDNAGTDAHAKGIDSRVLGHGKHIKPLDPVVARIVEMLAHGGPGD